MYAPATIRSFLDPPLLENMRIDRQTFKLHPISVYIGVYQGRGLGALLRRTFIQVLSVVAYLSGELKPGHIHGTAGTHRRSNPGT